MKWRKLAVVTGLAVGTFIFANESNVSANSVNDYIFSKNWAQNDTQNHIQWWLNHRSDADINYRHKKPEGVIVHETANSSDKWSNDAIWNEINYMLGHSDSAFVHSFVDEKQAIEIADPDFLSWGAGPIGNSRFIQTEQVQVEGKDPFAHELYNLAVLQAKYLIRYNLKPSLGNTVWGHSMVSHQLGGTNHSDPDGYWADMAYRFFGTTYTMNDYITLIDRVCNQMQGLRWEDGQLRYYYSNGTMAKNTWIDTGGNSYWFDAWGNAYRDMIHNFGDFSTYFFADGGQGKNL